MAIGLFLVFFVFSIAHAQNTVSTQLEDRASPVSTNTPNVDTTIDAFEEIEKFRESAAFTAQQIDQFSRWNNLKENLDYLTRNYLKHFSTYQKKKKLSGWSLNQASQLKLKAERFFGKAAQYKETHLEYLKDTETLIANLNAQKRSFKKMHQDFRTDASLRTEADLLQKDIAKINQDITTIKQHRSAYTVFYDVHNDVYGSIDEFERSLDRDIDYFKSSLFDKNEPPLYDADFFAQFTPHLFSETITIWSESISFNKNALWKKKAEFIHLAALLAVLWLVISRLGKRVNSNLLKHPLLTSVILTTLTGGLYLRNANNVLIVFFWVVLFTLLIFLVRKLFEKKGTRGEVITLLVIYGLIQILDTVGLAVCLYRLLLVGLGLYIATYCFLRSRRPNTENLKHAILLTMIAFFVGASIMEVTGYHLLTVLLIHGTIKSAFLIFAIKYLRKYFIEILSALFLLPGLSRFQVIKNNHHFIERKITRLFHLFIGFVLLSGLLAIWGVFDTFTLSLSGVWSWGMSLREHRITIGMIITASVIVYLIKAVTHFSRALLEQEWYPRKNVSEGTGKAVNSIMTYGIWVVGLGLILSVLGFGLEKITIIAGALSVGIGFGLQNIVNNFISGLVLLFERPIKVGDILVIDDEWGVVEKVGLRSTTIRNYSQAHVIIPNADFVSQKVINLTHTDAKYRIKVPISVAYGSDLTKVKQLLEALTRAHPKIAKQPEPLVVCRMLGESAVQFDLLAWLDNVSDSYIVTGDLLTEADRTLRAHGIGLPFPQRELHIKSVDEKVTPGLPSRCGDDRFR